MKHYRINNNNQMKKIMKYNHLISRFKNYNQILKN